MWFCLVPFLCLFVVGDGVLCKIFCEVAVLQFCHTHTQASIGDDPHQASSYLEAWLRLLLQTTCLCSFFWCGLGVVVVVVVALALIVLLYYPNQPLKLFLPLMSSIATELGMVQLCPGASVLRCSEAVFIDKLVLLFLWPFMMAQSWWFTFDRESHSQQVGTSFQSVRLLQLRSMCPFWRAFTCRPQDSLISRSWYLYTCTGEETAEDDPLHPNSQAGMSQKHKGKNLKRNLEYSQKLKFRNAEMLPFFCSGFQWLGLHSIATRVSLH